MCDSEVKLIFVLLGLAAGAFIAVSALIYSIGAWLGPRKECKKSFPITWYLWRGGGD